MKKIFTRKFVPAAQSIFMKKSRGLCILNIVLIITLLLTGCAKADKSTQMNSPDMANKTAASQEMPADGMANSYTVAEDKDQTAADNSREIETEATAGTNTAGSESKDSLINSSAVNSDAAQVGAQDKIIQNYYLDVETQDFDALITKLDSQINGLGGYVENSQIGGNSFYSNDEARNASIVARIPSKKAGEFVNNIKKDKLANIINNQKSTKNVSLEYIDAQSRIKALKIEQDRLFVLLEKTEKLENIITLESRLSEIRYELQNYESQLRSYDNQVEYSTVTLNIREVERITPVTEMKQSFTSKIKNGFGNSLYHIGTGFKNFLIWFIVNLPYLIIWGIIIFLIVLITRRWMKKSKVNKKITDTSDFWHINTNQPDEEQTGQSQSNQNHTNQDQLEQNQTDRK